MSYRGEYREIDSLEVGQRVTIPRPSYTSVEQHRRAVNNAVNHFGRTRDRKFRCRTSRVTGAIEITRIMNHADAERGIEDLM